MLKYSDLLTSLHIYAYNPAGDPLCLYGDLGYPHRPQLTCPFCQTNYPVLTRDMRDFNTAMSKLRVSVEWLFGDVGNYFKFTDYKKTPKLGMSAVGKQYIVSALMRNAHTCMYGNNNSAYFQLQPPTLDNYFV